MVTVSFQMLPSLFLKCNSEYEITPAVRAHQDDIKRENHKPYEPQPKASCHSFNNIFLEQT